jgi:hypothetical protein
VLSYFFSTSIYSHFRVHRAPFTLTNILYSRVRGGADFSEPVLLAEWLPSSNRYFDPRGHTPALSSTNTDRLLLDTTDNRKMVNATSSPLANAQYPVDATAIAGIVSRLTHGLSGWTVALTLFIGLVLYDQCMFAPLGSGEKMFGLHLDLIFGACWLSFETTSLTRGQTSTFRRKDPLLARCSRCHSLVHSWSPSIQSSSSITPSG